MIGRNTFLAYSAIPLNCSIQRSANEFIKNVTVEQNRILAPNLLSERKRGRYLFCCTNTSTGHSGTSDAVKGKISERKERQKTDKKESLCFYRSILRYHEREWGRVAAGVATGRSSPSRSDKANHGTRPCAVSKGSFCPSLKSSPYDRHTNHSL